MTGDGANYFLVVVTVVVTCLAVVANLYILVHFQHHEDRNQAWLPKIVVVFGLTVAELSILMLPLDVGNRHACDENVALSACNFTLPMKELWYSVYMIMAILVVFVIPLTVFYYEADSDRLTYQRWRDALMWVLLFDCVIGAVIGIAYGLAGFVDYSVVELTSGMMPLSADLSLASSCINPISNDFSGDLCAAGSGMAPPSEDWSMRTSFPVYVMALGSIAGWMLFMLFAGVGVVALPVDLIKAYIYRPKTIITKSEFVKRAREVAEQSRALAEKSKQLHRQKESEGKSRAWKKNVKELEKELMALEDSEAELTESYPQSTDPDATWTFTVLGYYFKLFCGVLGVLVSICWILHIILYMLVDPPVTPFLNELFVELDKAFSLFGTAAFALFCFYLLCCVIKGNMKVGLNLLVFTIHPMKLNGTLMSSFLFNVGLICLCSVAVIQFCATAFDVYANETMIHNIFSVEIEHLRGIKDIYTNNVFLYMFLIIATFSVIWHALSGYKLKKRHNREDAYAIEVGA